MCPKARSWGFFVYWFISLGGFSSGSGFRVLRRKGYIYNQIQGFELLEGAATPPWQVTFLLPPPVSSSPTPIPTSPSPSPIPIVTPNKTESTTTTKPSPPYIDPILSQPLSLSLSLSLSLKTCQESRYPFPSRSTTLVAKPSRMTTPDLTTSVLALQRPKNLATKTVAWPRASGVGSGLINCSNELLVRLSKRKKAVVCI
ncbi:hypothetical protein PRUPE_3G044300 [Prunus persica]|uniref:Uncharacterized protein n=1 Tax=Prunus persica TaxID=3760 RepID=A0A251PV63_PRUPE|nr:hypothetical protein PRUPE_3G044300 [Prunus persica]